MSAGGAGAADLGAAACLRSGVRSSKVRERLAHDSLRWLNIGQLNLPNLKALSAAPKRAPVSRLRHWSVVVGRKHCPCSSLPACLRAASPDSGPLPHCRVATLANHLPTSGGLWPNRAANFLSLNTTFLKSTETTQLHKHNHELANI
ncbi:hypothetical protein TYRP_022258, partial [Tyrophagus putrescentiae]